MAGWDRGRSDAEAGEFVSDAASATYPEPPPADGWPVSTAGAYAWERVEDQLEWYDGEANYHRDRFRRLKVVQIVIAALPWRRSRWPPAALRAHGSPVRWGRPSWCSRGCSNYFQFQQNWTGYRATAEALKHEKYLYLAGAGPYADATRLDALLAERVEALVSQEHSAWSSTQANARAAGKA